jgi:hypothetical protein
VPNDVVEQRLQAIGIGQVGWKNGDVGPFPVEFGGQRFEPIGTTRRDCQAMPLPGQFTSQGLADPG